MIGRWGLRRIPGNEPPALFESSRDVFWKDRYISRHILNAHLDPSHDDGSRRPETIAESVSWIHRMAGERPGRLLDLGCGPGLYAERFARLGWEVTGIDFSGPSIRFARRRAKRQAHRSSVPGPTYRRGDYRDVSLPERQDLVIMVYGDFCVLSEDDRTHVVKRIRSILAPGGRFVFDVFTPHYLDDHQIERDWYAGGPGGFWHAGTHLVLTDSHRYEQPGAPRVLLNRYIVVPALGRIKRYHLWYRPFESEEITEFLLRHGFERVDLAGDLTGAAQNEADRWIGVVASG